MIGYTTLGTNDLERARAFYDAVLAPLGGRRTLTYERSQYWGGPGRGAMLGLALSAETPEAIQAAHAAALAAGGACEGPPGDRGGGFYGAYFRDPDGNKLCVFRMGR